MTGGKRNQSDIQTDLLDRACEALEIYEQVVRAIRGLRGTAGTLHGRTRRLEYAIDKLSSRVAKLEKALAPKKPRKTRRSIRGRRASIITKAQALHQKVKEGE